MSKWLTKEKKIEEKSKNWFELKLNYRKCLLKIIKSLDISKIIKNIKKFLWTNSSKNIFSFFKLFNFLIFNF